MYHLFMNLWSEKKIKKCMWIMYMIMEGKQNKTWSIWQYVVARIRTELQFKCGAPNWMKRCVSLIQLASQCWWCKVKRAMTNHFAMRMLPWTNTCSYIHKHMQGAENTTWKIKTHFWKLFLSSSSCSSHAQEHFSQFPKTSTSTCTSFNIHHKSRHG
jgi:hypothetical protein